MKFESLLDHPLASKTALLRKALAFSIEPVARVERLGCGAAEYAQRPPVVVNSLPKSGTHLLLQITRALPDIRYLGRFIATSPSVTLRERSPEVLARKVSRLLPGETLGAHLHHSRQVSAALSEINALHLFIYRDPRDVIVSEVHYLAEMSRWHRMHRHFAKLEEPSARLALALDGLDARYPECNQRLLPYSGWLADPDVVALRYEDLAGERQADEVERVIAAYARRVGKTGDAAALAAHVLAAVRPERSHTFRRGGSGRWREGLSASEADALTARLKESLEAFGYE